MGSTSDSPLGSFLFYFITGGTPDTLFLFLFVCNLRLMGLNVLGYQFHPSLRRYFQHAHFIPIVGVGKRASY